MPKFIKPLSDKTVRSFKADGMHSVGGADGLYLQIKTNAKTGR